MLSHAASTLLHLVVVLTVPVCSSTIPSSIPPATRIQLVQLPKPELPAVAPITTTEAPPGTREATPAASPDADDLAEVPVEDQTQEDAIAEVPVEDQTQEDAIAEATPEPEPERMAPPAEDAPPEPERPDWIEYIQTTADMEQARANEPSYISSRNTRAAEHTRTRVTAPDEGPQTQQQAPSPQRAWSPGLAATQRTPRDTRGQTLDARQTETTEDQAGGSPNFGNAQGSAGGPRAGGAAPQRPAARERSATAGSRGTMGSRSPAGFRAAPEGLHDLGVDAGDHWRPTAARIMASRPRPASPPTATLQVVQPPLRDAPRPTPEPVDVIVRKPAPIRVAELVMVPVPDPMYPDEPLVSDDPTPQRTEAPTEAPEVGRTRNPVEVLREQLGWGNSDNDDAQARNADAGTVGSQSDVSASAQTVLPDSDDAIGRPSVNARATPLGRYVDSVDKIIRERWFAAEIDPMHRALGIEGTVVVQLDIRRSGRVADVKVYASSGYPHLDAVALAAIPSKVPRIPKELDLEHLAHRISLRDLRGQEDRPPRRVGN